MDKQLPDAKTDKNFIEKTKKILYKRIHILQWLPSYTKGDILADFISGLTVGLTMMPQSIAYAGLAGVAPQYGLYTAFIGSFTYVFFGTIKEVSIGPTSLMSLLTFSYIEGKSIDCVILLTFIAGCVELLMGMLKLGFLVDFISPCLTSGFTSATTIIIIAAQLKHLLGVKINGHGTIAVLKELCQKLGEIQWTDATLGCSCIVALFALKQLNTIEVKSPTIKKLLWFIAISKNAIVVVITSIIGAYLDYSTGTVPFKLTGSVPKGMPEFGFPSLTSQFGNKTVGYEEMVSSLGSGLIVIPLVAVLANVAIAKAYSADVVVDASQEMMSLGLCNIFGSFVKAMPSCGAFTRSAVASSSDVRTPLQGIYSGGVIILALGYLAPYFYFIPKSTLAAVLITAASSLIDYEIFPILWKCNKVDFFLTAGTFVVGIIYGVETAIVIGCIINALALLKMWSRPKIAIEIRTKEQRYQRYLLIIPELGLYYPAADFVSESVKKAHKENPSLSIVLDCRNILKIDYAAAKTIEMLLTNYNSKDTSLFVTKVNDSVMATLRSVIDEECLALCTQTEDIYDNVREGLRMEDQSPLLSRKLSSRKTSSTYNGEGRLSVFDLE